MRTLIGTGIGFGLLLSQVLTYSENILFACYLIKLDNIMHENNQAIPSTPGRAEKNIRL